MAGRGFPWTPAEVISIFNAMSHLSPAVTLGLWVAKLRRTPTVLWRLEARLKGVVFQGTSEFLGRPLISVAADARMVIGDGFHCYSSVRANPLGGFQPCVLRAHAAGAELRIGRGVGMSSTVLCAAASITVGEGTIFGAGALVMDTDFHRPSGEWGWRGDEATCRAIAKPVSIGRGVFVGARAIILKGVTIGDRAVVGAGAVVTKDVPPGYLVVGNPGRLIEPKQAVPPLSNPPGAADKDR
jgi:acetyltransferase-like isoleucine patch superfamily enzyme